MVCQLKHTKFQPTPDQWKCPKCGTSESFLDDKGFDRLGFIIESSEDGGDDCDLLHENDEVKCYKCGYTAKGKSVSSRLAKINNAMPCPHCKGTGFISKERS